MLRATIRTGLAALAATACVAVSGLTTTAAAAEPIKIGIIGPMAFIQGEDHWAGAVMAEEEINKAGGIDVAGTKRPVELVKVDSNEMLSVPDAANAMERAITRDKVDFVLGAFRSEAALAMQDVAMDYKKIFIVAGASLDEMGVRVEKDYNRYKYWFRITPLRSTDLGRATFAMFGSVAAEIKTQLGVPKVKVAVVAEKAAWTQALVKAAEANIPKMGMELVGLWQPSPVATDVTGELSAIKRSGAHLVFTIISGPMGIVIGRQMTELQIPAVAFGINVEAQKEGFWKATDGKGNYVSTLNTYAGVEITPKTIPFVNAFRARHGRVPTYTAATYDGVHLLKESIEKAGTLNADDLVPVLEKTDRIGTGSHLVFDKRHDSVFGPGFATGIGVQWQDGKLVAFWPNGWQGVAYKGAEPFKLPASMKR
jgi:branched-chain amino acid transport system substrate-binding protein